MAQAGRNSAAAGQLNSAGQRARGLPEENGRAVDADDLPQGQEELLEERFGIEIVEEDGGVIAQQIKGRRGDYARPGRGPFDRAGERTGVFGRGLSGQQTGEDGIEQSGAQRLGQDLACAEDVGLLFPFQAEGVRIEDQGTDAGECGGGAPGTGSA